MPLMEKALSHNIKERVYSDTQIQKYAVQILSALDFLHSKDPQILHRH